MESRQQRAEGINFQPSFYIQINALLRFALIPQPSQSFSNFFVSVLQVQLTDLSKDQ